MKSTPKILVIWFLMGSFYYALEGLYRLPRGGYANVIMLFIGGLCGLAVGSINQIPKFYKMRVIYQSLIGTLITLLIEFLSGCILNIGLGMHIWDYSNVPLNIAGQICLPFALIWLLLMPFAIWMEDAIRNKLFGEGTYYTLKSIYVEFFTLN